MSSLSANSNHLAGPVAMISLAGVAVVLRIAMRLKRLAIEDLLVVVSLVFSGASTGYLMEQSSVFFDPDSIMFMTPSDVISVYEHFGKTGYLSSLFYSLSFGFIQTAFLLSCLRWLSISASADVEDQAPAARPRSSVVQVILGVIIIYNLWLFSMLMAKCMPLQGLWRPVDGYVMCLPQAVWWTANLLHILVNFLLLLLGIAMAVRAWVRQKLGATEKRATTRTDQKIGLAFIFVLGFFVCVVSVLRVIRSPSEPSNKSTSGGSDLAPAFTSTWERTDIWTVIELNVAIVCACLSTLNPLSRSVNKRLLRWCPVLCGRAGGRGGSDESDGGSMTKIGELDGVVRAELENGNSHGELEGITQRQELDGVARQQQRGELDGTAVAELDGGTTHALQGRDGRQ